MSAEGVRTSQGLGLSSIVREDLAGLIADLDPLLQAWRGASVLIAGGAGFLGSYLVDVFASFNDQGGGPITVRVLDNFVTGTPARLAHLEGRSDVTLIRADVSAPLAPAGPADLVIHAASIASPPTYRRYPVETITANVWGTRHLLDYAVGRGSRRFLYISSSEVYGDPEARAIPTPETYAGRVSFTGPRACYDESKRLAETLCLAYQQTRAVPVCIVRPFNVYGPRLSLEDGRVVPDLLRNVLAGEPLEIFSDGTPTRSFCYISDFTRGALAAALSQETGEIFNLGSDEEISIAALAGIVSELAPGHPPVRLATHADPAYLTDNPNRRCPDLAKARAQLGYRPRVATRDGLARTLRHYLASN